MLPSEHDAIIWNGRSITWAQLDNYIHSTSRRLKEIGVVQGSRVFIEGVPTPGMIIACCSLWHIGAVVCPFDPRMPEPMLRPMIDDILPMLVLTERSCKAKFPRLRVFTIDDVICLEPVERFMAGAQGKAILSQERDATVIFTSGSSGDQKAVLHTFAAHWHNAMGAAGTIPFTHGDRWLMALPLYRVSGMAVIFRSLFGGGAILLPGTKNGDIGAAIIKGRPTHISLVPAQFFRLIDTLADLDWRSLKAILIGGAPVPDKLINLARRMELPVFLTYGMTETGSQIATSPISDTIDAGASVLPFREVTTINGEICVRGKILFKGYIHATDIISPVDADGWYHTGDAGSLCESRVIVTGRLDRMFISGGENIFPETIEKALLSINQISAARVEPRDDDRFGRVAKAYIRWIEGAVFCEQDIKEALKTRLLPFQIPKEIIVDDKYPFPEK